jgi:hypothetical protein
MMIDADEGRSPMAARRRRRRSRGGSPSDVHPMAAYCQMHVGPEGTIDDIVENIITTFLDPEQ